MSAAVGKRISPPRGDWRRALGFAVAASAVALLLTELLRPWLGQTIYLFFYPAVMVGAWYGGFGAGAVTALMGAVSASYLFMEPLGRLKANPSQLATALMLVGTAWLLDALYERLRVARQEAEERARHAESVTRSLEEQAIELEAQVEENQALLSELEESHARLQTVAVKARAASDAKSAFLATISHELRTPLNAIAGYAELIEIGVYGPVSEGQIAALARIRRSQDLLLTLIDQVLDQAKAEAGTLAVEVDEVRVEEVVRSACEIIEPQAKAGGLDLRYACLAPGVTACADRARTEQIVLNLLSNAVKFSEPDGEIVVECGAADGRATIAVIDSGIGIPAAELESIFEPFVQVDQSRTRSAGGAGLGLTISRELARAMAGELEVTSVLGEGSTFRLTLPAAPRDPGSGVDTPGESRHHPL